MKKLLISILITFLTVFLNISYSLGVEKLYLTTDNYEVKENENFKIYINIRDIEVASYTINIYFDNSKVEYVSGTENTNVIGNKIINIWYDESGGKNTKKNQQIAVFEFKAKQQGLANFYIQGEFFDNNANKIQVNNSYTNINIIEENNNTVKNKDTSQTNNSLLKIMRLDKEGIIPEFSPDIKEYYFTTDLSTNNLEVTAIPESENAKVLITGNENLKKGLNKISIEVTSSDNTNKSIYTINVTKTDDIKAANTNLEMLAIENITLEPLFDVNVLNYKANVSNDTKNINIFAVPENINAKVDIIGNKDLNEGDNIIKVRVTANNGYSYKDYILNIHRRTIEEDKAFEEEQEQNSEKLNDIIDEKGIDFLSNQNITENKETEYKNQTNINKIILIITSLIMIIGIGIFIKFKMKNKKFSK